VRLLVDIDYSYTYRAAARHGHGRRRAGETEGGGVGKQTRGQRGGAAATAARQSGDGCALLCLGFYCAYLLPRFRVPAALLRASAAACPGPPVRPPICPAALPSLCCSACVLLCHRRRTATHGTRQRARRERHESREREAVAAVS
jgi:hypothetical protein